MTKSQAQCLPASTHECPSLFNSSVAHNPVPTGVFRTVAEWVRYVITVDSKIGNCTCGGQDRGGRGCRDEEENAGSVQAAAVAHIDKYRSRSLKRRVDSEKNAGEVSLCLSFYDISTP
jgi:hypothetical protein